MNQLEQSASDARNEAFRRLGRNLYLVQLIEHQLKHLVVHSSMHGYPEELQRNQARKVKRARKESMGKLADRVTAAVFRGESDEGVQPRDPNKSWVSFAFRIDADQEFIEQRKKELRRLVRQRNSLIHAAAADIRPDDADKWVELGAFLDAQRAELVAEHEKLRLLIKGLAEMAKDAGEAIERELLADEKNAPRSG